MSVYPGVGPVSQHLNRYLTPRNQKGTDVIHIMWTSTLPQKKLNWFQPNHFVPLLCLPQKNSSKGKSSESTSAEYSAENARCSTFPSEALSSTDLATQYTFVQQGTASTSSKSDTVSDNSPIPYRMAPATLNSIDTTEERAVPSSVANKSTFSQQDPSAW